MEREYAHGAGVQAADPAQNGVELFVEKAQDTAGVGARAAEGGMLC
jgi:hypothetical protein